MSVLTDSDKGESLISTESGEEVFGTTVFKALAKTRDTLLKVFSWKDFVSTIHTVRTTTSHSSDIRLKNLFLQQYLAKRDNLHGSWSQIAEGLRETPDFVWDAMIRE